MGMTNSRGYGDRSQMSNSYMRKQRMPMWNRGQYSQRMQPYHPVSCYGEEQPVDSMGVGMAYVPWQRFENVMDAEEGLECGTIFRELVMPYYGRPVGRGGCER